MFNIAGRTFGTGAGDRTIVEEQVVARFPFFRSAGVLDSISVEPWLPCRAGVVSAGSSCCPLRR